MTVWLKWLLPVILVLILYLNCRRETHPLLPLEEPELKMTIAETGICEVFLRLQVKQPIDSLTIYRNGHIIFNRAYSGSDTLIYDNTVEPATSSLYTARAILKNRFITLTDSAQTTTGDTTSHDFTWYIDTLGTSGSLMDVYAVSENDVWVVGNIRTPETHQYDSLGIWVDDYNAAHWDGNEWEYIHVKWKVDGLEGTVPLNCINGISTSNIWTCSAAAYHWDGNDWTFYSRDNGWIFGGEVYRIWCYDENNVFYIGQDGKITFYNGNSWRAMPSTTDITLRSISGTGPSQVWACGYPSGLGESILLEYNGRVWKSKYYTCIGNEGDTYVGGTIKTVYATGTTLFLTSGSGVLRESLLCGFRRVTPWYQISFPVGWSYDMDGTGDNNIFIVGEFGTILHFNGKDWKKYPFYSETDGPRIRGVSCTPTAVFAATTSHTVYRGYR